MLLRQTRELGRPVEERPGKWRQSLPSPRVSGRRNRGCPRLLLNCGWVRVWVFGMDRIRVAPVLTSKTEFNSNQVTCIKRADSWCGALFMSVPRLVRNSLLVPRTGTICDLSLKFFRFGVFSCSCVKWSQMQPLLL